MEDSIDIPENPNYRDINHPESSSKGSMIPPFHLKQTLKPKLVSKCIDWMKGGGCNCHRMEDSPYMEFEYSYRYSKYQTIIQNKITRKLYLHNLQLKDNLMLH